MPDDIPNPVGPTNIDLILWEIHLNISMPPGYEVLPVSDFSDSHW